MREHAEFRPKPMVEIGGRPILWHIMQGYLAHGFDEFVLCLGHMGSVVKDYFLHYEAMTMDFTIRPTTETPIAYHGGGDPFFSATLVDTGQNTLTGGRIKQTGIHLGYGRPFMVTYGDGVSDVNVFDLLAFHRSHGKLATVTAVRASSQFGVLDLAADGTVRSFAEKPKTEGWINAGFFVFEPGVFDYLDDGALEQGPLSKLASEGKLMAYKHDGFFHAMDTPKDCEHLNKLWDTGKAPWKVW